MPRTDPVGGKVERLGGRRQHHLQKLETETITLELHKCDADEAEHFEFRSNLEKAPHAMLLT